MDFHWEKRSCRYNSWTWKWNLFVKQYRPAIKKELIEIPAGLVEKGEDILDAAKREFEEEIGYRANKWEKICSSEIDTVDL